MSENQRLKILIDELDFKSQAGFAKAIGVTPGGLSDVIRAKNGIRVSAKIKRQLENSYNVNIDWLESGEGAMFKGSKPRLEAKPIGLADPEGYGRTGEKIYTLPDGSKIMEVKVVGAKSQAGYLRGFGDPEYYEDLPVLRVTVNEYHKGTYLAFQVSGDSMTPDDPKLFPQAVLEGWYVIGREVLKHHWAFKLHTHSYDKWIIVHRAEGILIKQIIKHDVDAGTITVHSLNPMYDDQELKLSEVEQIFNVVKIEIH